MIPLAAALASALLMWAAFPPLNLGLLAFVAPAPLLFALRRVESPTAALGIGFVYGLVFYGGLLSFILVLGAVAWIPLVVWLSATSALFGLLVWAFRTWPNGRWFLIAVGGWTALEFLRATFPFGGFPWGQLGTAAAGVPGVIGSVQWVGPSGWTVLAVAVSAGIVLVLEDPGAWRLVVDPAVVVVVLTTGGVLFAPSADGDPLRVAIVQGGSPCPGTHCQNEKMLIYESHLELTQAIPDGSVDLIVWPENSLGSPFEPADNPEIDEILSGEAERLGAYFIASGTRSAGPDNFYNVNTVYAPNGSKVGEYQKRHPVPFGEYVPLRDVLDFIPQLERVPRDMIRGEGPVVFETPRGLLGTVISFEGAFARLVRSEAQIGAELIVIATNEASFGSGAASDQLIGLAKVNAAAVGQDLVHAAITGKSTFITASGGVGLSTELFEETVLIGEVRFRDAGPTLFTRFGEWLALIAIAGAFAAALVPGEAREEQRRRVQAAQSGATRSVRTP
ncbi:MAG: apolipoprotein N-acyltransferase [Acidimicrobiia bacterium]|nr:apolipoprotein N-acyltransferase [Acidimicrobiia bacterium]